jgi:serine/threonine-protein kinase
VDSRSDSDIQIAGYQIEARIGRGGMGAVYRAVQLNLGRRVALKVLAPDLAADDRFRRRFLRESRIAASIDHPSIIPIYETGEDGGRLYIAMRYVDGPDLAAVLRREGRLEPSAALAILAQVAGALDAAHERGLVHRDVKPANMLLASGPAGTPSHCYLCDFGLIKQLDSEQVASALTITDQIVGTIPYVAPEQIEGRAVDGRTDVYSLGCVLFQCLTGSVPFEGSSDVEVVFAHLGKPPPSLSERIPSLPRSVDGVIARAMAKSKEDRWPTCTALVGALATELKAGTAWRAATHPTGGDPAAATQILHPVRGEPTGPVGALPWPAGGAPGPAGAVPGPAGGAPGPAGAVPGPVHTPQPAGPPPGKGRRGRWWLALTAAVVLPVGAYLAAADLVRWPRDPRDSEVTAAPTTLPTTAPKPSTCRWTRPEVGTPARSAPLAAIRAHMGWTDRFVVDEMRSWTSSGTWHWYVKAHQERDPSRRGRWLVRQQEDGQRLVLASAEFTTKGYAPGDWTPAPGQQAELTGLAACLAGT